MATKKYQITQLNANNQLDVLHPETSADNIIETTNEKVMTGSERTKLAGIEAGAEVNEIVGVQVNGSDLTIDANRKVNILMPTDVGADLEYDANTGVLSLLDKDSQVLGSVDLPLELLISSGYYDSATEELVLVLSNFELSNPQPTSTTFKTNKYYTYNSSTNVYTLASVYDSSQTYYEHSEIRIPVGDLIEEYVGDGTNTTITRNVSGQSVITFTNAFLSRISAIELKNTNQDTEIEHIKDGTTKVAKSSEADALATARTISYTGDATGSGSFDGSADLSIALTLKAVGTAGTYSVVQTDVNGRVVSGAQLIEVGTTGQTTPSNDLAVGGLFFKEI